MKEHKLTGTIYDEQGETMVLEQIMDSYRVGTTEDERVNGQQRNNEELKG
ncbi:hypothetical protein [Alkalihalobacterium chitinilyticum]|uniref:Uncharacterized protein n=1 Tax=Alkalihalobacterium chitinilyticum TaxID=2980103 RepID=A0ABT5VA08_9BACI|nr:hypothetical protein [Alkalihalobacterium chitinilyticum]MDE5412309.1 hypothetical protein [Alkalihalobacterium chitinilyticum]